MSERQRFIRPSRVAQPELVAACLRRIAHTLDGADDQRKISFSIGFEGHSNLNEVAAAWSQAALLLADEKDIDSMWLNAYAATIYKGVQDVLPTA